VLSDALQAYAGTICLITHDRTLIREVANKIIEIRGGDIQVHPGGYDDYVNDTNLRDRDAHANGIGQVAEAAGDAALAGTAGARSSISLNLRQRRMLEGNLRNEYYRAITPIKMKIEALESEITALSAHLTEVEAQIADPASYADHRSARDMASDHQKTSDRIDALTDEWGRLSTESERLTVEFTSKMDGLPH
jgi:ATP-binding cassette subfamily F protein 3